MLENPDHTKPAPILPFSTKTEGGKHKDMKGKAEIRLVNGLRMATINCKGLNILGKREHIINWMRKNNIDVACLQETQISSNSKETINGYTFYFSSSVKDKDRDIVNKK